MTDRNQMWRDMRQTAKRLLRNYGPMTWGEIRDRLYERYGHECEEDIVMGPELDNDGVRRVNGKYLVND